MREKRKFKNVSKRRKERETETVYEAAKYPPMRAEEIHSDVQLVHKECKRKITKNVRERQRKKEREREADQQHCPAVIEKSK